LKPADGTIATRCPTETRHIPFQEQLGWNLHRLFAQMEGASWPILWP
jgi:hypothetical protein